MKKIRGQKIKEGIDFIRVPSLTLAQSELNSIPEPPAFEDLNINGEVCDNFSLSEDESETNIKVSKSNFKSINRGQLSKTLRYERRLSSIPMSNIAAVPTEKQKLFSKKSFKFLPKINDVIEQSSKLNVYHVQVHGNSKFNVQQELLYGDDIDEEYQILNTVNNQKMQKTTIDSNDDLVNEIVNSYKLDYMETVESFYAHEKKLTVTLANEKTDLSIGQNVLLTPPVLSYHHHTSSITSASDMSTLPEKLFSSPEIDRKSSASSVYSDISICDYDDIKSIKTDGCLKLHKPTLVANTDNNTADKLFEKKYENLKIQIISVSKPKLAVFESDMESESEDDNDNDNKSLKSVIYNNSSRKLCSVSYNDTVSEFNSSDYYEAREHIDSPLFN
ncbi:hypothetical protein QEN19_001426 [Hanseniaspora menglaensis]